MQTQKIPYEKSIMVCTKDCQGEKPSCGDQNGEEVFRALRCIAKERGLHPRMRVGQAKCLGQCGKGVNIMIYPDEVWISEVKIDDIEPLADLFFSSEKND